MRCAEITVEPGRNKFLYSRGFLFILMGMKIIVSSTAQAEDPPLTKAIQVIGTGTIQSEDVATARDQAISKCLAAAVDKVAVDFFPLDALIRNFDTINEALYGQAGKLIQGYKVLTETRSGNIYRVLVQVTVSLTSLQEQLSRAGIALDKRSLPKVLFFIAEQNIPDPSPQYWWAERWSFFRSASENSMTDTLREKGFSVIDYRSGRQNIGFEPIEGKPDLNNENAVSLGTRFQADVVIVGRAMAQKTANLMGADTRSFKGTVTARAVWVDTGEEIAATTQSAVAVNTDETIGGRDALLQAGTLAGANLASQISRVWQKESKKTTQVEIIISGTGRLANFVAFRGTLNDISGVKAIRVREMKPNEAVVMVDFQGSVKALAEALMLKTFDAFGVNISEVLENRLRIELVPG